jgi:uncharacterized protein (TIGR03790 family)
MLDFRMLRTKLTLAAAFALLGWWCAPCRALEPDQIALVVNSNAPAGRGLAEFYAQKRGIPDGRIVSLDLPFPNEEVSFAQYDDRVVPRVRSFLRDNGLRDKVRCLVTFYGVPLRIGRRAAGPPENEQINVLQREVRRVKTQLVDAVTRAEALAKEVNPAFAPGQGDETAQLARRASEALSAAARAAAGLPAGPQRDAAVNTLTSLLEALLGEAETAQKLASPELSGLAPPKPPDELMRSREQAGTRMQEFRALQAQPRSPRNDQAMRAIIRDHFGLFRYVELLNGQYAAYESKETESSLDSELALLWWDNRYPRYRWQMNALNYKIQSVPPGTPPTLMVMRLDGPAEEAVDRIILSSLKVEQEGLKGQVALDGRGMKADDGYGKYDHSIRNLADLLKARTKLTVTFDDREALFQPGPGALKDVALYCGWYSLRNYVPAFTFSEGAVGFHVASSELVSLHAPDERGWVRGLINDGVVATLGPVAEPYLQSFPPADEFFPLLMTGELTLAEVYWKTTPMTSWMTTCIGDPLYRPYKANPALKKEDLPEHLRAAVR